MKNKTRVAVITAERWLDALHGSSILGLFTSLASLGYEIEILVPANNNQTLRRGPLLVSGLQSRVYVPVLSFLSLSVRNFGHLMARKPDVLIFDFVMLPVFLLYKFLLRANGIMLILSRPVGQRRFSGWMHFVQFRLSLMIGSNLATFLTAISPFEAAEFRRLGKIRSEKMVIVPSPLGSAFEEFSSRQEEPRRVRLDLGLDELECKKVLLYHGVLARERGVMELIHLFSEAFKSDDRVVLLIAGDGPAKEAIRKEIRERRINNIVLLGSVPYFEVPSLIAACDAGLVILPNTPSWRYQTPTKLIELLALNKRVVASDLPGVRWIAGDSALVVYLKSMTAPDLRAAVQESLARKGSVTDTRIFRIFSTDHIARELSETIRSSQSLRISFAGLGGQVRD